MNPEDYEELINRLYILQRELARLQNDNHFLEMEFDRFKKLYTHSPYEIHIWQLVRDDGGKITTWKLIDANPQALKSWNKKLNDIVDKTTDEIFTGSGASILFMPIVEKIFRENKPHIWEKYFPGTDQTLRMVSIPFDDYFISSGMDISDIKRAQKVLERTALYDELTGVANRKLFQDRLELAIKEIKRSDKMIAVLFVDLDFFKKINDSFGHSVGDKVLISVAEKLLSAVRETDTVARLGGDEFLILLTNIDDVSFVSALTKKIMSYLSKPMWIDGNSINVELSIGVAVGNKNLEATEDLIKNADLAMYRSKKSGRSNFHFFSTEMELEFQEYIRMEKSLKLALENDELTVFYQPKVDAASSKVVGFEALVRWHHPEKGLVCPEQFISIAEKNGLIVPIGRFVIDKVCKDIPSLIKNKILPINGRVSINLSGRQFRDSKLLSFTRRCIERHQVDANNIEFEITESVLMKDLAVKSIAIQQFHDLGIVTAIDDFGTGYSSLSYLQTLPIKILKIDKSFLIDSPACESGQEIISAVIVMAHKLGLSVVAEGVEHQSQVDFLRSVECDYLQGFFFGEPAPYEEELV